MGPWRARDRDGEGGHPWVQGARCHGSTGRKEAAAKEGVHRGPGLGRHVPKYPRKDPKT